MSNENNWITAMIITTIELAMLVTIMVQVIGIHRELKTDRGDMNYDGKIDFTDFSIFALKINESE